MASFNESQDRKGQIDLACKTAEEFVNIYYDKVDNKRQTMNKIYLDNATLTWNGNRYSGSSEIQGFFMDKLPMGTSHLVHSLDAQPVDKAFVGGNTTVLVQVCGTVQLSQRDRKTRGFQQNFLLTAEADHWKIATDTFRFQEPTY